MGSPDGVHAGAHPNKCPVELSSSVDEVSMKWLLSLSFDVVGFLTSLPVFSRRSDIAEPKSNFVQTCCSNTSTARASAVECRGGLVT